ncbi:N-acetylglutamate synthase and related acetyltransferases [Nocardioides sp. J9]|uniref:GNAT family N-acetyltransferase n=1 Tax=unclassified Nocardioides TaxID=2615069 RepID=UPI000A076D42|nr:MULTISPECIES: GNAT family N-acetyltransferase [unclassified Nocardioides]TWG99413.1 N-acetylglutamate synthase and related acetyltransferases [Nocardioides sp. J9]
MSAGGTVDVVELTAADADALRDWAAVTAESARHEVGDHATAWAYEELLAVLQNPSRARREQFFVARRDGEVVGTTWLAMPLLDNLDSAQVDVHVRPDQRRRGTGSVLLRHAEHVAAAAGRTRLDAEAQWPHTGPADGAGTPGVELLRAHGYAFGIGDVQRELPLPVDDALLAELAGETAPHHRDYRLESWAGPVPDDLVEGWLAVVNTLMTEAPTGGMEREEEAVDVAAFRASEALLAAQGRTAWRTAALDRDGTVVAYTEMILPSYETRFVYQWGTLVRRDHRGHRLGTAVKVANHRALQAGADVAGRRVVTWNAEVNDHMIGINERLGFVVTCRAGELQKRLTG